MFCDTSCVLLIHVLWTFFTHIYLFCPAESAKKWYCMTLHGPCLGCAVWVYGTWGRQDTVLLDIIKIPGHWYLSVVTRSPSLLVLILTLLLPPASIMPERVSLSGKRALVVDIYKIHNLQLSIQVLLSCWSSPPSQCVRSCWLSTELHQVTSHCYNEPDDHVWCYQEVLPGHPATLASLAWVGLLMSSLPWRRPSLASLETTTRCLVSLLTPPSHAETRLRWWQATW